MSDYSFKGAVFDLDGIITKTAVVHSKAWKMAFDEYLKEWSKRNGKEFVPFTYEKDYLPYVDGRPRYQGVDNFLRSRGIELPFGDPSDGPDKETCCGIGNRKNKKFVTALKEQKPEVFNSTVELINALRDAGIKVGVASSSKNCKFILQSAGLEALFETRVDGVVSKELNLKGKPEGDIFVVAAENMNVTPDKSIVFEDATSGVAAGKNGGFGLVVGVDREDNVEDLYNNGADIVFKDLDETDINDLERRFVKKNIKS